jgi:hypothetical protein
MRVVGSSNPQSSSSRSATPSEQDYVIVANRFARWLVDSLISTETARSGISLLQILSQSSILSGFVSGERNIIQAAEIFHWKNRIQRWSLYRCCRLQCSTLSLPKVRHFACRIPSRAKKKTFTREGKIQLSWQYCVWAFDRFFFKYNKYNRKTITNYQGLTS